jgi:YrbI family 3-deoxy-D-manno-octulosonate 8-phosphate phosphatase
MAIELVILDIDGVLTDGTKIYDEDHNVIAKKYCDLDFTAIKRMVKAGVNVCFLSGDKRINEGMANKRGIDFWYSRQKLETLEQILDKYKCRASNVAFMGDDVFDIPVMKAVSLSCCPINSPVDVQHVADKIFQRRSGEYLVSALYDYLALNRLIPKAMV